MTTNPTAEMHRDPNERKMFVGHEVERTVAFGLKTLFVAGLYSFEEIVEAATSYDLSHIYLAANHSWESNKDWVSLVNALLKCNFIVSLEVPAAKLESQDLISINSDYFILMISVEVKHAKLYNKHTCLKIDDSIDNGINTNPGVWCVPLETLTTPKTFTAWSAYTKDEDI